LEPTQPEVGRPYYRAVSKLQVLALVEEEPEDPDDPAPRGGPDGGSISLHWWRRSQRCRTVGQLSFDVALLDTSTTPTYIAISRDVNHLSRLGMSDAAIARHLEVSDKTVRKAITWYRRVPKRL
jgi:hypothetical protein